MSRMMRSTPGDARRIAAAAAILMLVAGTAPPAPAQTAAGRGGEAARMDAASTAVDGSEDGWTLDLTPYLWATGIEGEVGIRGRTADIDLGFGDLIDRVDGALMLVTEARRDRWGIGTELILFKLSDEVGTPGPLFGGVEISARMTFIEISPRYRILDPEPVALDLILGARVWHLSQKLRFTAGTLPTLLVEAGDQWIDPVLGLRAIAPLGGRWLLQGRGDIGGLSVGSDLTWQLLGVAGYRLNDSVILRAGYRHLDVDFLDEEDGFLFDVGLGGWIVGATIRL